MSERLPHEPDYIARTIATVRNHRDADNCWPQWANIFADQIEALASALAEAERERDNYRISLTAHHEMSTLSDEALRESIGRTCQICARAHAVVRPPDPAETSE